MRSTTDQGTVELIDNSGARLGTPTNPLEVEELSGESLFEEILTELKKMNFQLALITETDLD